MNDPVNAHVRARLDLGPDGYYAQLDDGTFVQLGASSVADAVAELGDMGLPTEPSDLEFGADDSSGEPLLHGVVHVRALGCCDVGFETC